MNAPQLDSVRSARDAFKALKNEDLARIQHILEVAEEQCAPLRQRIELCEQQISDLERLTQEPSSPP